MNELTLTDYFAAKALQALLSDPDATGNCEQYAEWAYKYAHAMIAEKKRQVATSETAPEPTGNKRVLILQEDDCAPDHAMTFAKQFQELVGCTLSEFKAMSKSTAKDDYMSWKTREYLLECGAYDPYYSLYKI